MAFHPSNLTDRSKHPQWLLRSLTLLLAANLLAGGFSRAQPPIDPRPAAALQTVTMAVSGSPYGVARIEIPLAAAMRGVNLPPLEVTDDENRILYPVTREIFATPGPRPRLDADDVGQIIGGGRLLRRITDMVREVTEEPEPAAVAREVTFLFRGDQPLRVRLSVADVAGRTELLLTPGPAPVAATYKDLLAQWWSAYTSAIDRQIASGDYPPIVENYLVALLSGRLDLPLPANFLDDPNGGDASLLSTLGLIAGTEAIQTSILRRVAAGTAGAAEVASLPLPEGPRWSLDDASAAEDLIAEESALPESALPQSAEPRDEVVIEPSASRVPPECFYLRFGSFANYMWLSDLSAEYGGDISRMITLRGVENKSSQRIEQQLVLKTTELARLVGDSVIQDESIIGTDLFLSEGASLGVLFHARNTFVLRRSMESDRAALLQVDPTVTERMVKIDGRDISLIESPGNRVRSFLAVDGEFVLVSNSETLVRRFLEVGRTGKSLGQTAEFRLARKLMPISEQHSVFAFISPAMLRGLVSPQYLIEMRRRLESAAEMSLLRLARLASAAESQPLWEVDDLVDAGFLPLGFGDRPDGSGLITVGNEIVDSRRGRSGTFLPIADTVIGAVTDEEDRWYREIANYHSTQWKQMDPITVALRRTTVGDPVDPQSPPIERLHVRAEIAPWSPEKYGTIARQLGPPTAVKISFAPDDIISVQAHVVSDQLGGSIPPHHLFAAIKDTVPPSPDDFDGLLKTYGALRGIPGYIGAWPYPGLLDRLPLGIGRGQPVGPGMTRLVGGVYRFQGSDFSILSFQPEILQSSLPHIVADQTDDLAQLRIRAGNLTGSKLESWANAELFRRTVASSQAGAALLNMLTRQLKVDRDQSLQIAEDLLGAKLQDPLGGDYRLVTSAASLTDHTHWASSKWRDGVPPNVPPTDYLAPVLTWFRGGEAHVTQFDNRVSANLQIDIQRKRIQPQIQNPPLPPKPNR
ncbi:MAG TPA: hypothetical protein DDZ51_19195 [Planctomycetaceae bacterium]|nr:hypothetical protein [Planctomycetaceae bacterium]